MIEKTISADKLRKVIVDRSERDGKPVPKVMLEGLSLRELSNISTAPADKRIEYARQYQRANFGGAADEFGEGGSVDAEFKFGGEIFSGDSPYFWMPSSLPRFEQGGNVSRYPAIPSVTLNLMTEAGLNLAKLDNAALRNEINNDRDALAFMSDYVRQWAGDASSYHEAKKIVQEFDDRLARKVAKAFGVPASDIPKRSEVEQRHKMWMSIKKNG